MIRCISWVAVSSKPQTEKESPIDQANRNKALIDEIGGVQVASLEVPGESREIIGFDDACSRIEAYAQLRTIMQNRGADLLVCRDLSRLGRTTALIMQVVSYCHQSGIAIYSRSAPPSSIDATEQSRQEGATLMLALESAMSQAEMIRLRHRNRMGTIGKVKRGEMPRGAPYGYIKIGGKDGQVVIVPEEANIVRRIFDEYVYGGMSATALASGLAHVPAPRGGAWGASSVSRVLGRAWTYAGYAQVNINHGQSIERIRVPGNWEAIISDDVAKQALEIKERRASSKRVGPIPYSGVLHCDQCGAALYAMGKNATGERGYRCSNKCLGSHIIESRVTAALRAAIRALSDEAMIDQIVDSMPDETDRIEIEARQTQSIADRIERQRIRLVKAYTLNTLSDDEYMQIMGDLENQLVSATKRLDDLRNKIEIAETPNVRRSRYETVASAGLDMLDNPDIKRLNAWVRKHFVVYVADNKVSSIEYL